MILPICRLLLHQGMRLGGLLQRKDAVDHRAKRPASSSGHIRLRSAAAIAPFSAVLRGRMVEPVR